MTKEVIKLIYTIKLIYSQLLGDYVAKKIGNECTKVQNPRCVIQTHAQNVNFASRKLTHVHVITIKHLCTAGSTIALTRAVRTLLLLHAVTSGASLYIEQENWSQVGPSRLDLIRTLPLSPAFSWFALCQAGWCEIVSGYACYYCCMLYISHSNFLVTK